MSMFVENDTQPKSGFKITNKDKTNNQKLVKHSSTIRTRTNKYKILDVEKSGNYHQGVIPNTPMRDGDADFVHIHFPDKKIVTIKLVELAIMMSYLIDSDSFTEQSLYKRLASVACWR